MIAPFLPENQPGPERKDDRQIISGILHVISLGVRAVVRPALVAARFRPAGRRDPDRLRASCGFNPVDLRLTPRINGAEAGAPREA